MPSMGEWFAELSTKGLENVQRDFARVGDGMKKLEAGAVSMASTFKTAFVGMTGVLYGFATAGIAGSVQGERLGFQIKQLSLQIGSIFVPVVERAIETVSQVTEVLRGLSGESQNSILKWAGLAGGIALFATGIGTIPGIMLTVTSAFSILGDVSENVIDTIVEGFGRVADVIIPIGQAIWSGLVDAFEYAMPIIMDVADLLMNVFETILPPAMTLLESFGGLFKATFQLIMEVAQLVMPVVKVAINGIVVALQGMAWILDKLIQALTWIVSKIKDVVRGVREEVQAVMAEIGGETITVGSEQSTAVNKEESAGRIGNRVGRSSTPRDRTDLVPKSAGGFEGIGSAYTRIAQTAINQFDPAKASRKAEEQREKTNGLLDKIVARVGGSGKAPALAGV